MVPWEAKELPSRAFSQDHGAPRGQRHGAFFFAKRKKCNGYESDCIPARFREWNAQCEPAIVIFP